MEDVIKIESLKMMKSVKWKITDFLFGWGHCVLYRRGFPKASTVID